MSAICNKASSSFGSFTNNQFVILIASSNFQRSLSSSILSIKDSGMYATMFVLGLEINHFVNTMIHFFSIKNK